MAPLLFEDNQMVLQCLVKRKKKTQKNTLTESAKLS